MLDITFKKIKWLARTALGVGVIILSACQVVEYSPYDSIIPEESADLTQKNINQLGRQINTDSTITIAILSDSHQFLDDLSDAITHISHNDAVDFVVVPGDITKYGLKMEFILFKERMDGLNKPYVTAIGNHECVAEGVQAYKNMFGSLNYSFEFNQYRFVIANTNGWHFDNTPDFNWLEETLRDTALCDGPCKETVVFSHVAPFQDQFTSSQEIQYVDALERHDVMLSVHGHSHNFSYKENYLGFKTDYLVVDDVHSRNYILLTIDGSDYNFQQVYF